LTVAILHQLDSDVIPLVMMRMNCSWLVLLLGQIAFVNPAIPIARCPCRCRASSCMEIVVGEATDDLTARVYDDPHLESATGTHYLDMHGTLPHTAGPLLAHPEVGAPLYQSYMSRG